MKIYVYLCVPVHVRIANVYVCVCASLCVCACAPTLCVRMCIFVRACCALVSYAEPSHIKWSAVAAAVANTPLRKQSERVRLSFFLSVCTCTCVCAITLCGAISCWIVCCISCSSKYSSRGEVASPNRVNNTVSSTFSICCKKGYFATYVCMYIQFSSIHVRTRAHACAHTHIPSRAHTHAHAYTRTVSYTQACTHIQMRAQTRI